MSEPKPVYITETIYPFKHHEKQVEFIQPFKNEYDVGYIRIPTAMIDSLMPVLSANEFRVFLFIIRKTWGWNKESDLISYGQIHKGTGIASSNTIQKALDGLVNRGLVVRTKENVRTLSSYAVNRNARVKKI